jgi:MoxR-like ATPase
MENSNPENEAINQQADASAEQASSSFNPYQYVDVSPVQNGVQQIKTEVAKVVVGQDQMIELLLAAICVGGHVLVEGLPGIAKTLTAKLVAKTIDAEFSRIQFTPDLMPTDVTGTSVFNQKESNFYFRKGPIFAHVILVDEINRAPAKTQAALMEVMEEKQLTYDGQTYPMGFPFFIMATQNPVEQEGTYSLPEAQLDRFVFRIKMGYPTLNEEEQILMRFQTDFQQRLNAAIHACCSKEGLAQFIEIIQKVHMKPELVKYIAAIVHNTRNNGDIFLGASPRASLAMLRTSKAIAAMRGRDFVTPDDIRYVAGPVLNHRIVLSHEREMEGHTVEEIIEGIIQSIEVPR